MSKDSEIDDLLGAPASDRRVRRTDNARPGHDGSTMEPNTPEAKHLLAFIERIERLEEDKRQVGEDIKDVLSEAKGTGFDVKIIKKIISIRKQDKDKRREEEEILGLYLAALGMEG